MPSSTSQKFESLTKIETFPNSNEEDIQIDLKGHTIEELAIMANVSVDVIKSAIRLRKEQMKIEHKVKGKTAQDRKTKETVTTTIQTSITPVKSTTLPTTISHLIPSTTTSKALYATKKIKKYQFHNEHKVKW